MPTTFTRTVTLYRFSELSDKAKSTACEWFRGCQDSSDFSEYIVEDAQRMGAMMGITIDDRTYQTVGGGTGSNPAVSWSLHCQGAGASFDGSYRYVKGAAKAIRKECEDKELFDIADRLQAAQKKHFYLLQASVNSGRSSHSRGMDISVEHSEDQYRDIGDAEEEISECLRDFADWIYRGIDKEYDYQTSDEVVAENIEANEYTFDVDGNRKD